MASVEEEVDFGDDGEIAEVARRVALWHTGAGSTRCYASLQEVGYTRCHLVSQPLLAEGGSRLVERSWVHCGHEELETRACHE
eukprot:3726558-Amphidinium_carterae.1